MSVPYTRGMNEAATYWPSGTTDEFNRVSYGAAVAIICRWEDKVVMFRDSQGNEVASEAVVYVDRELEIGGRLAYGTLSGTPPAESREIRQRGRSPSLDATRALHKVFL